MPRQLDRKRRRRLRPVIAGTTLIVVVTAFAGTINARPPSTANSIGGAAFGPVVIPGGRPQQQAVPELRRRTDADPLPAAGERVVHPAASPAPTPIPAPVSAPTVRTSTLHAWPLQVRGLLTTRFSARHPGIDLAAPAGTPVRAIAGGKVVESGWQTTGGGYVLMIRHADGMLSRYLHNRRLLVRAGQWVKPGQQIAEVGSTGWSTGPHLDLRVWMGSRWIDPLRLEWRR